MADPKATDSAVTDREVTESPVASRAPDTEAERNTEKNQKDRVSLIVVSEDGDRTKLSVEPGRNLRRVLLEVDLSPYASVTKRINCGGRGLCATCGVRIREEPPPTHWHDRLAKRFGYPRLSCQVTVEAPMTVKLVDKRVWGSRK